jgi:protein TonB
MNGLMKDSFGVAFILAVSISSFGQRSPKAPNDTTATNNLRDDEVSVMVEIPAMFPGGEKEFAQYIKHNLKYPKKAAKQGLTGNVYVELVVNADGSINDDTVRPVNRGRLAKADRPLFDPDCQREAVRLLKSCPRWEPATRNGKPEQQAMVIAVPFFL